MICLILKMFDGDKMFCQDFDTACHYVKNVPIEITVSHLSPDFGASGFDHFGHTSVPRTASSKRKRVTYLCPQIQIER